MSVIISSPVCRGLGGCRRDPAELQTVKRCDDPKLAGIATTLGKPQRFLTAGELLHDIVADCVGGSGVAHLVSPELAGGPADGQI